MKRRSQGQIVVMHAARIDAKLGARRTSAEKNDSSAAPHSRERVVPAFHLPAAFDHQVGSEAAVEIRDLIRSVPPALIEHAGGTHLAGPLDTLRTAPDH